MDSSESPSCLNYIDLFAKVKQNKNSARAGGADFFPQGAPRAQSLFPGGARAPIYIRTRVDRPKRPTLHLVRRFRKGKKLRSFAPLPRLNLQWRQSLPCQTSGALQTANLASWQAGGLAKMLLIGSKCFCGTMDASWKER